jgi:hypothetical protein
MGSAGARIFRIKHESVGILEMRVFEEFNCPVSPPLNCQLI